MDYVLIGLLLWVVDWIVLRRLLILGLRLIKKWTEQRMSEIQCVWRIYSKIIYYMPWRSAVEKYLNFAFRSLSRVIKINSVLSWAIAGPCGSKGKGDVSLWLGGKGDYVQAAGMTNISCLSEHSLFRSHTHRQPLIDANLKTVTCDAVAHSNKCSRGLFVVLPCFFGQFYIVQYL